MIKKIILILLVLFGTSRIFCQNINNNIYNHKGINEFASEILQYKNGFLVLSNIKAEQGVPPTGILIRHIDDKGNIIWRDFYKDETDSLYYYLGSGERKFLISDSLLFVFGNAQDVNLDVAPFLLKYNLNQKKVVDFQLYNSYYGSNFYTAHLHTDGYFYAAGVIYKNRAYTKYNGLLMKIDKNGDVVWQKEYANGEKEDFTDIESNNNMLICVGRINEVDENSDVYISKIDTSGNIIEFKKLFEFGSIGVTRLEILDDSIYFTTNSEENLVDEETTYLSKMDSNFNIVWDTLIASSSKYDLGSRRLSILNNQIIINGTFNPSRYTNHRIWGYATSWSLDGHLNWEQRFVYDPYFLTNYIDDVIALDNGDFIFMGTLSGLFDGEPNQNLWLFRTDSLGCGTIQPTCYYTLDDYFAADTITSIIEPQFSTTTPVQILGNPFTTNLQLTTNESKPLQLKFYNTAGQLFSTKNLSNQLSLNTQAWPAGIYFMQVFDKEKLLAVEKVIKQ